MQQGDKYDRLLRRENFLGNCACRHLFFRGPVSRRTEHGAIHPIHGVSFYECIHCSNRWVKNDLLPGAPIKHAINKESEAWMEGYKSYDEMVTQKKLKADRDKLSQS